KQKANQLNYRSTFIYLLFIKHVTKKSLILSNQAFLNKWRSGRGCYTEHQRAPRRDRLACS
ncbi:hypothetical protein ACPV34_21660, partial [Photobacterium damselae]|uniref:hypothetical protein n=1 Tax=Photobacterium damselae TaxID=38293 RepID=UPI004067F8AD